MRRCTSSANATTATPPPSAWSTAAIIIAVPPPVIEPPRLAMLIEPTRKPATNTTIPATFHHLYECLRIVSSRMIVTGRRRAARSRLEPPRVAKAPNVAWRRCRLRQSQLMNRLQHSIEALTMQQTICPPMVQHGMKFGATPPVLAKPAPAKTALTPASAVVRPRRRIANLLILNPDVSPSTLISLLPKLRLRPEPLRPIRPSAGRGGALGRRRRCRRAPQRPNARDRTAPLEDDPHGLPVAEEREVAHAEPCELRDLLGTDAEVAVRGIEQHHHHRHVPLLSQWGTVRGEARPAAPPRSSGSSLDFELGYLRGEFCTVAGADFLQDVGDVPLDRF